MLHRQLQVWRRRVHLHMQGWPVRVYMQFDGGVLLVFGRGKQRQLLLTGPALMPGCC